MEIDLAGQAALILAAGRAFRRAGRSCAFALRRHVNDPRSGADRLRNPWSLMC